MKKLALFIIVLISLVVIAGCNHSKKTVTRFSSNEDDSTKTTVTKIDNGEKVKPIPIKISDSTDNVKKDVEFSVTSPATKIMNTNKGYHLIQGSTPSTTNKILINNKSLSKYKSGETQWNYIAAASLGTLQKGRNYYKVIALDKNDKELATENFTIIYKGIENGALISVGNNSWIYSLLLTSLASYGFFYLKGSKRTANHTR